MKPKKKNLPEYCEIFVVGKSPFLLYGDDKEIDVYRANRGAWKFIRTCETYSGAKSLILDSASVQMIANTNPDRWLAERYSK